MHHGNTMTLPWYVPRKHSVVIVCAWHDMFRKIWYYHSTCPKHGVTLLNVQKTFCHCICLKKHSISNVNAIKHIIVMVHSLKTWLYHGTYPEKYGITIISCPKKGITKVRVQNTIIVYVYIYKPKKSIKLFFLAHLRRLKTTSGRTELSSATGSSTHNGRRACKRSRGEFLFSVYWLNCGLELISLTFFFSLSSELAPSTSVRSMWTTAISHCGWSMQRWRWRTGRWTTLATSGTEPSPSCPAWISSGTLSPHDYIRVVTVPKFQILSTNFGTIAKTVWTIFLNYLKIKKLN